MLEIDVLTEIHPQMAQRFACGLEVPALGVDQNAVVVPEEIATRHLLLAA
jgi:hypothetical protein